MTALDQELQVALQKLYPDADAGTVTIDVWERVEAGDLGTPGAGSELANFSAGAGGGGGLLGWLPFVGIPLLVGALVFGVATTGLLGRPGVDVSTAPQAGLIVTAPGLDCPGGSTLIQLRAGTRVLALERTADGAYIAVRDPAQVNRAVWVSAAALTADDGAALADLPEGAGCPVPVVQAIDSGSGQNLPDEITPGVDVPPSQGPGSGSSDVTAPVLGSPTVSYSPATGYVCSEPAAASSARLAVSASDAVGVTAVTGVRSGSDSGPVTFTLSGGSWVLAAYTPGGLSTSQDVTITITARDAAGNTSAPVAAVINRDQCPG